ncbi:Rxt3 transcriptional repressor [Candida orthopsilosis Co 90-125]|uniref:Rxt3 transcriptional repressor n=1 Tax=Candida orthopsilosis (strain 90-125) TaxID=1136231 RepID=H8WYE0_CANO9|nr:Rxt3 transcriptional repressor [Candida orthopsilosis Co 90-125]CCG21255.1 Rxt3 transcriptional repressor [Candida orthopsilosis Co 90-125]
MSNQPEIHYASSSNAPVSVTTIENPQQQSSSQVQNQSEQHSLPHHHHHHHHHHVHPHHRHHHHHIVDNPNHHHHHHLEHNNNSPSQAPTSNEQQQLQQVNIQRNASGEKYKLSTTEFPAPSNKRNKPQLNTEPIKSIIEEFFPNRRFIGTIIYNPTTTWETLQTRTLYGLKPSLISRFDEIKKAYKQQTKFNNLPTRYIPVIPPLPQEYINSVIEIKIPFRYIVEFKQDLSNGIVSRELWGGASGVYTDDSDILQVLLHIGFFNDSIDLSVWNKKWTMDDILRPINALNQASKDSSMGVNKNDLVINETEPQKQTNDSNSNDANTIPQSVDKDIFGDLSVQVLLLPSLPSYHGFFANGINSRSWNLAQSTNNQHSGLSYVVYNIKWEERGSYLQDKALMRAVELENEVDYELNHELMREKGGWNFDYDTYTRIKGVMKG